MKVYGHPLSTCTRKVLTVLAEKGAEAEFVMVDILTGQGQSPEHLARQPWGHVPVLEDDDGWQLYESRAICRYLDAKLPGPALSPADLRARAVMEQWISIESSNFTPAAMKIIFQLVFGKFRGAEPNMAIVEEGRIGVRKAVAVMERQLAERDYLLGDSFSLADIFFMPYIDYLGMAGEQGLVTDSPRVGAWWSRISGRASWLRATGKAGSAA